MTTSLVMSLMLLSAPPHHGTAPALVQPFPCAAAPHVRYRERVYYGYYDRPGYDYRIAFDYPWCSPRPLHPWPMAAYGSVVPPAPLWVPHGPEFPGLLPPPSSFRAPGNPLPAATASGQPWEEVEGQAGPAFLAPANGGRGAEAGGSVP